MKPIDKKDTSKVVIIPRPPQNPTQKSETAEPDKAQTGSDQEEAQEETPEE